MSFTILCQECGHSFAVAKDQFSQVAHCPICSAGVQLPRAVGLGPKLTAPPPADLSHGKPEAKSKPSFPMACPACGVRMRLLEKYRDTLVRCPDCNEPFMAVQAQKKKVVGEDADTNDP